jgi:hypothetical protein
LGHSLSTGPNFGSWDLSVKEQLGNAKRVVRDRSLAFSIQAAAIDVPALLTSKTVQTGMASEARRMHDLHHRDVASWAGGSKR